jgi:hypothetical protein
MKGQLSPNAQLAGKPHEIGAAVPVGLAVEAGEVRLDGRLRDL